jgi:hypothetical protein
MHAISNTNLAFTEVETAMLNEASILLPAFWMSSPQILTNIYSLPSLNVPGWDNIFEQAVTSPFQSFPIHVA